MTGDPRPIGPQPAYVAGFEAGAAHAVTVLRELINGAALRWLP